METDSLIFYVHRKGIGENRFLTEIFRCMYSVLLNLLGLGTFRSFSSFTYILLIYLYFRKVLFHLHLCYFQIRPRSLGSLNDTPETNIIYQYLRLDRFSFPNFQIFLTNKVIIYHVGCKNLNLAYIGLRCGVSYFSLNTKKKSMKSEFCLCCSEI